MGNIETTGPIALEGSDCSPSTPRKETLDASSVNAVPPQAGVNVMGMGPDCNEPLRDRQRLRIEAGLEAIAAPLKSHLEGVQLPGACDTNQSPHQLRNEP